MKIGIDARMYGPTVGGGGLGRYVKELVDRLQTIDQTNRYVLFLKKENWDTCKITNPRFEKRLADIHWYTLQEQILMKQIIEKEELDLVHFPHWNIPYFIKTPFITTIHDLILLDEPFSANVSTRHKSIFAIKYWGYKRILKRALTRAKHIIAVSETTKQSIQTHIPAVDPTNISVVYEGLTPLQLDNQSEAIYPAPYLLYVGNAYPHKNLEMLTRAFNHVRKHFPSLTLILAGRRSIFYDRLLNTQTTGILFHDTPTDEELVNLYKNAELFVYPTRIEGFGLPPLEAINQLTPTIVSDIPILREILQENTEYMSIKNAEQMAENICAALTHPIDQKTQELRRQQVMRQYNWNSMTETIKTLYEKCAEKHS